MPEIIRYRDSTLEGEICDKPSRLIQVGNYPYTLHPFQAVMPQSPSLMQHAAELVVKGGYFKEDFDYIFALAQKSIPFATHMSIQTGKPLVVAYSRHYEELNEEMQQTELKIVEPKKYADDFVLYSYFINSGAKVTFVGDDVNWGDASAVTARLFANKNISIPNYVVGVEKHRRKGVEKLFTVLKEFPIFARTIIHVCASVEIEGDRMIPAKIVK